MGVGGVFLRVLHFVLEWQLLQKLLSELNKCTIYQTQGVFILISVGKNQLNHQLIDSIRIHY